MVTFINGPIVFYIFILAGKLLVKVLYKLAYQLLINSEILKKNISMIKIVTSVNFFDVGFSLTSCAFANFSFTFLYYVIFFHIILNQYKFVIMCLQYFHSSL